VPEPAAPWANAGAVASMVATATIVIVRMGDAPDRRRGGAVFLKSTGSAVKTERTGSDLIRNGVVANVGHEGCVLIKLILRLLHCRKSRIGLLWPLICRASG
jgi:hypothetical protein